MLKSTEQIMESGFKDCVFRDIDLASLFKGTSGRRYSLVSKALKAKELIRVARGYYILGPKYHSVRVLVRNYGVIESHRSQPPQRPLLINPKIIIPILRMAINDQC